MRCLIPAVLLLAGMLAGGESPVDLALARWTAAVVKAGQTYDTVQARADAPVVREAERAAASAARRSDAAAVLAAWCEVLRVDPHHAGARQALSGLGRLDEVLAGLATEGVDLLEPGAPVSDDPELRRAIERRTRTLAEEGSRRATAWDRADAAAVTELERAATRLGGRGDAAAATPAWREVLRLARNHAQARAFFAGLGTLEAELAGLDALGTPHAAAMMATRLRGAAAAFVFGPRTIAQQEGIWLVQDRAGGRPAVIHGLAAAPTTPWLALDGTMMVELPDPSLVRSLPFTVACWLRPQAQTGNPGIVGDYVGGTWNGFLLQLEGPHAAAWMLRDHANRVSLCREIDGLAGVPWQPGAWLHLAVTVDDRELALYGDGRLHGRQAWRGLAGPTTPEAPLLLGRYGSLLVGDLASVTFWRRALSAAEIAQVAVETAPVRR